MLQNPFLEEEIKKAVFDSYAEGAPSPDGFSFLFYQKFWDLIKSDLIALLDPSREVSLTWLDLTTP